MPLPRVRFTVRRMMIAVAVVAPMVWAARMDRLSSIYRERARDYTYIGCTILPVLDDYSEWNRRRDRWMEHRRIMRAKYERAARYPFLLVAPDPPEPE